MEPIPRVQPRSCMLLDSCLYVLSMNMFVFTVTFSYNTYMHRGYTTIIAEKEGLCCLSDFAAIVCILFLAYS